MSAAQDERPTVNEDDPENDWITGQVLGVDGGLGSLKVRVDTGP